MIEIWKDVDGYRGAYQVSNLGRIKSTKRVIVRSCGKPHPVKERFLKPAKDSRGYLRCAFMKDGKLITHKVHRLVAAAFVNGFSELNNTVNHINGIKTDNCSENLEWLSISENVKHSFKTGLQKPRFGEKIHTAKLNEKDIKHIRNEFHAFGISSIKIAKGYLMNKSTILDIVNYKIWKQVD